MKVQEVIRRIRRKGKFGAGRRERRTRKHEGKRDTMRVGKRVPAAPPPSRMVASRRNTAAGAPARRKSIIKKPGNRRRPAAKIVNVKGSAPSLPPTQVVYDDKPGVKVRMPSGKQVVGQLIRSKPGTGGTKGGGGEYFVRLPSGKQVVGRVVGQTVHVQGVK